MMGKRAESWDAVLAKMRAEGPLMVREQLKLLKVAAVEGTGERVTRNELLAAAHMVSKEATKSETSLCTFGVVLPPSHRVAP